MFDQLDSQSEKTHQAPNDLQVIDLGLVGYQRALDYQLHKVDEVSKIGCECLIVCTHQPVVTLGRGTREGDVFGWQGELVQVQRGGRATYHGPNQIVIYPILNLDHRGRDLHLHMRKMEQAMIETLKDFSIEAQGKSKQIVDGEEMDATGVWVGTKKLASIGIGVRQWISFHGLALNIENDPNAFQGLKPCGFQSSTMTSMQEVLGFLPNREEVKSRLLAHLIEQFKI